MPFLITLLIALGLVSRVYATDLQSAPANANPTIDVLQPAGQAEQPQTQPSDQLQPSGSEVPSESQINSFIGDDVDSEEESSSEPFTWAALVGLVVVLGASLLGLRRLRR